MPARKQPNKKKDDNGWLLEKMFAGVFKRLI
jgi:hypothetical protein